MRNRTLLGIVALFSMLLLALPAGAWHRSRAQILTVLPDGSGGPEGLTVGPDGNIYVTSFGFNSTGELGVPGQLFVISPDGRLLRHFSIQGASKHLLGLAFQPHTGALLVLDFGAGKVLKVDPTTGSPSVFATITPGSSGLNALTFDAADNVYVSDSFQGIVWKIPADGGQASPWAQHKLLTTTGVPPFGANGIEFNKDYSAMFVANTGDDTIVKIPVDANGNAEQDKIAVFVNSINGADGIVFDNDGNLWVAANQADEIVVIDPTGKVIAKLGDFDGLAPNGTPRGLLFPASPAFSKDGHWLYVTNLALDLRIFGLPEAVDSQWCAQVKHYTVSKIVARIPNINGDPDEN